MAGLGAGYAWPNLEVVSDGENLKLTILGERVADAAAIRYLNRLTVEVSAKAWEDAVERFLDVVETRLSTVLPAARELPELRAELRAERADPTTATRCRREARAGHEPGEAPPEWHERVDQLALQGGPLAAEELLAVTHDGGAGLSALERLRSSATAVDLSAAGNVTIDPNGKPWQRATTAAQRARALFGVSEGPLEDRVLTAVLGQKLPLTGVAAEEYDVLGGFRPSDAGGTTQVLLGTDWLTGQRFALARLFGMAALFPRAEQGLVLTPVGSAPQKFSRAFAIELLCPWRELDAFTDAHGVGESAIARAARRYRVSEMAINWSLVNHGKIDRDRLAAFSS